MTHEGDYMHGEDVAAAASLLLQYYEAMVLTDAVRRLTVQIANAQLIVLLRLLYSSSAVWSVAITMQSMLAGLTGESQKKCPEKVIWPKP